MARRRNDQNREKAIAVMVALGVRPAELRQVHLRDVIATEETDAA
jgi:hypothetical protein